MSAPAPGPAAALALRPMRRADLDAVMVIERQLFGAEAWTDTMFRGELAQAGSRWYAVAERPAGVIAGYAGLCVLAPEEAYVQTIAVAPPCQRQGIGSALLQALIDQARRRGACRLDLEVRADNDIAQRMYTTRGFTPIGRRRGYYQPSGVDAIIMRKILDDKES